MKAVVITKYGGPDVLELANVPEPHAGRGQLRVRVHAAAVNPADVLFRVGDIDAALNDDVPRPYRPGMDVAGILDEIGEDADTDLRVGERVMAMVVPIDPSGGAYAEFVVLQPQQVTRAPAGSDHAHAATVPMNGLTARHALDVLDLPPDAWIAVTGAAGAVGGYVVELAKADGLHVVADAGPTDRDLVSSFGADIVVPRGDGIAERIRSAIPGGVDAVIDTALSGAEIEPVLRPGGQLAILRKPGERGMQELPAREDIEVRDVWVPEYRLAHDKLDGLRRLAEEKKLTMRVAHVYPAAQAPEAHRRIEAGGVRGRLVLEF
ncbi:NADP-dependent oxidoreductase [Mycolicibacterium hodleri]|uniref:NADP-dependent oxidoreductase n=1 Tax=Mycolicibacterium hodleri TaxID=49897 RepID=A0A502E986_9MYCO|nr:NADP-dependent oxidoreductase [Mycolicibacterium hodleri]TPG33559.1 NADP-dependent oxidoreductase [Mycolicibacterium hodleri]